MSNEIPENIRRIEIKLLAKDKGESGKRLLTQDECLVYAEYFFSKSQFLAAAYWKDEKRKSDKAYEV